MNDFMNLCDMNNRVYCYESAHYCKGIHYLIAITPCVL